VKVVVVGGGFAGLAAAIDLQEHRHDVVLLERRGVLGGRATSYRDAVTGDAVDNGTHLMIGAYRSTFDLLRRAGALDLLSFQDDLRIDYVDDAGFSSLRCPPLKAPLHLLAGLVALRLPWRVRWEALRLGLAVRFGEAPSGITLAEYFERVGQSAASRRLLWDPLALAILNETPERAAAVLFHRVYREAFLASHQASRLVFLRRGYGAVHERLAAYFEGRGGTIRRRAPAEGIDLQAGRVVGVRYLQRPEAREAVQQGAPGTPGRVPAEAVVLATPWLSVPPLLPDEWRSRPPFEGLARLRPSPIVSIELWLDGMVVDRPMVGLRDSEVEWVFDKGRLHGRKGPPQHLAFIVSAACRSAPRPNAELVDAAHAALVRYFPAMRDAGVTRSLVLREPCATFASDPEAETLRPDNATPIRGLFLAGDWTDTGLPATIEGAVRSGLAAARLARAAHRPPDRPRTAAP
jgi:squalene-associated FAD-dependent desaturase